MSEVAAKVMRSSAASHSSPQAFFAQRHMVQRDCAGYGSGGFFNGPTQDIQRQGDDEALADLAPEADTAEPEFGGNNGGDDTLPEPQGGDDEAEALAPDIQPQLQVGPVNDPLEAEADVMADRVVQRQAATSAFETENGVQMKAMVGAEGGAASPEMNRGIARAHGGGASLSQTVRGQMEGAFGVDLSPVRVHTGSASAAMNDQIGARAFTHGTDIHFNSGEFDPASREGTRLLAHEMTHVVQQNSGLRRKAETRAGVVQRAALGGMIQPSRKLFGPAGLTKFPKGGNIHAEILPIFIGQTRSGNTQVQSPNADILIEPSVPGGNTGGLNLNRTGEPDFYRNTTAIGLVSNGTGFDDINTGLSPRAPRPPLTTDGAIEDITSGPVDIGLADLKPASLAEELLGVGQLRTYSTGIKNTAQVVNQYQNAKKHNGTWNPKPFIDNNVTVPDRLQNPSASSGMAAGSLWVYEFTNTGKSRVHDRVTGFEGSVVVHKSAQSGIYTYEWVPSVIPSSIGNDAVVKLLRELENNVVPKLQSGWQVSKKAKPAVQRPIRRAQAKIPPGGLQRKGMRPGIQRAAKPHVPFDHRPYKAAFQTWNKDVVKKKVLGTKAKPADEMFDTLTEVKKRTGTTIAYPDIKARKTAKAYRKIRHWRKYGNLYVWFRKRFDAVWVKLSRFGTSIKDKIARLRRSVGSSGFGNWIKAAAKALLKVFKTYAAWAITEISDKLLDSLQEGVMNVGTKLMDQALPEGAKSKIEELHAARAKIDGFIGASYKTLEKTIFGDNIKMMEDLQKVMSIVGPISTIVQIVKWGVKIAACAAPPLVGCLWNLAITALEFAFAKILETCWFGKKVFGWLKSNANLTGIDMLWKFPTDVANFVVKKGNGMFKDLGLPEGTALFAPISINPSDFKQYDGDCGGGGGGGGGPEPTSEQRELMRIVEKVGEAKFKAFLEMMAKRGAGTTVELTLERIQKLHLEEIISGLTIEQMRDIANSKPVETTVPVEEFMKSIKTHTKAETDRNAKRDIDYEKAKEWNPKYKKNLGWDPTKFVDKDRNISPGSKEFADAVYDAQEMMGMKKPDGMVGKYTVKEFYEKNRQPKDKAYENATAEVKAVELAIKQQKEIAKILATKFPSMEQLEKDLGTVTFPGPEDLTYVVAAKKLIVGRTFDGSRVGAYYKEYELENDGKKVKVIIGTSPFLALDAISQPDVLDTGNGLRMIDGEFTLLLTSIRIETDVPKGGTIDLSDSFRFVKLE